MYCSTYRTRGFKSKAREQGTVRLIDIVRARLDAKNDCYIAELPSLVLRDARISGRLVQANERILSDGFYAEVTLEYDPVIALERNGRPFAIAALRPVQMSNPNVLDTRTHQCTVQLRPFDADRSGTGLGLPVLAALVSGMLERKTRGGAILVGPLNLGGSLGRVADPVAMAELALDKQAAVLMMPVATRRELINLPDDTWTKLNIEFYSDAHDGVLKILE